jgi:hypothetical protein
LFAGRLTGGDAVVGARGAEDLDPVGVDDDGAGVAATLELEGIDVTGVSGILMSEDSGAPEMTPGIVSGDG